MQEAEILPFPATAARQGYGSTATLLLAGFMFLCRAAVCILAGAEAARLLGI